MTELAAAAAICLTPHYGGPSHDSGIALLPGELFGYRARSDLSGPEGPAVAERVMKRARAVADVDAIPARCRY